MAILPSGLPENVADEEFLARFLTQSNQFNKLMAKPVVFLPSQKDRETSVFRHGPEPAGNLWTIGQSMGGDRKLYGATYFTASSVRAVQLEVSADEPPQRHAVIRGWPWNESDPELQKAEQLKRAALIASKAELLLREV